MIHQSTRMLGSGIHSPVFPLVSIAFLLSASLLSFQQASADVVNPGTTAYFDNPEYDTEIHTSDCSAPQNICGSSATQDRASAYAFSIATSTQRARQSTILIKSFSVPASALGDPPQNTVLDARVTGLAKWRGTLWALDFATLGTVSIPALGPTADAYIRVSLVDVTDPSQPFEAGNAAIADFHCDPVDRELGAEIPIPLVSDGVELEIKAGWCEEYSEDTFNFGAKVIQGHDYELQLTMVCQAITGAVPTLLSACSFSQTDISYDLKSELQDALDGLGSNDLSITTPDVNIVLPNIRIPIDLPGDDFDFTVNVNVPDINIPGTTIDFSVPLKAALSPVVTSFVDAMLPSIDDGYLEWDYMTVTIDPDVTGLLNSTKNEILGEVGLVRDELETVRRGVARSIKLLHTPQGKRETGGLAGYPDLCGDGDCDWPERR